MEKADCFPRTNQGCPLSLFNIVLLPASTVRQERNYKRFKIGQEEVKLNFQTA